MPPSRDRRSIAKNLRKYRLEIARVILRNEIDKLQLQSDIDSNCEAAELCDAYAIKMFCDWLGTKYDFPAYTSAIDSDKNNCLTPLGSWDFLRGEYPFADCLIFDPAKLPMDKAREILESALDPSTYLLGSLYEQVVDEPLVIDSQGQVHIDKVRNRRLRGQFYTPAWIVRYCFERAWKENSDQFMSAIKAGCNRSSGLQDASKRVFKLLDPACGSGNFLIGALGWLSENGMTAQELARFAEHSLFGVELDGRAAGLCRLGILLSLSEHFSVISRSQSAQAAGESMERIWQSFKNHISVSDSVMNAAIAGNGESAGGAFDLVVTNPPYISFGSRGQAPLAESSAKFLRRCYPDSAEYKIRLHSIFQEIAVRYAGVDGCVVLFLPDAFLTGSYYQKLRRRLLNDVRIESLTELPEEVIGDATVGRWCVASYKVRRDGSPQSYDVELLSFVADKTGETDVQSESGETERLSPPVPALRYKLPVDVLVGPDRSRFRLIFDDIDSQIWTQVDRLPPLSSVLTGHTGIRAISGQKTIISDRSRGESWVKGITSGSQVTRHLVTWVDAWLNVDPALLFGGGFDREVVGPPKLMVRQTADRVIAGFDDSSLYHLNNVHSLSPNNHSAVSEYWDLSYFDGLINSSFWLYLYQAKSREAGRALAQIDIEMLESMPIPAMRDSRCRLVSSLAAAAGRLGRRKSSSPDELEVVKLLSLVERSIDCLVYDLYDLTQAQILRIEALCRPHLPYGGDLPAMERIYELVDSLSMVGTESVAISGGGGL